MQVFGRCLKLVAEITLVVEVEEFERIYVKKNQIRKSIAKF